jgi:hypothetical protein
MQSCRNARAVKKIPFPPAPGGLMMQQGLQAVPQTVKSDIP